MSLEEDLLDQRLKRTAEIEALGFRAYGQRFDFTHTIPDILRDYSAKTAEETVISGVAASSARMQPSRYHDAVMHS